MGENGPIIPSFMIEACLIGGAKKFKEGNVAKAGMYIGEHSRLIYDGPKAPEELYLDEQYRDKRAVVVQNSRIIRTRPIFPIWEADTEVFYEDTVVNGSRIDEWIITSGNIVGFGDMRPRYGRFEVKIG